MSDIYISEKCIMCPKCNHVLDKPLIVNCENNCVICETCFNKLANIKENRQVGDTGVIIKVEVEEQLLQCICGSSFEKTKTQTDFGLVRVIDEHKCEG